MTPKPYAETVTQLATALARLKHLEQAIRREQDEPAEHALAVALVDIAESARRLADEQIPAMSDASAERLAELLHEAREELRHICYHVADSPYLRTVLPPDG